MKKFLPIFALITTSVIWGFSLPLLKVNLEVFPPLTLAFVRFFIASIVAISLSELSGLKIKDYLHIGAYAIFGISINVGLLLFGLKNTSATDATLILSLSPIFTSVLAMLTLKEKITRLHLLGIILAFVGIFAYILHPIFFEHSKFSVDFFGDLLIFVAMISAAIYTIGSKKLFDLYHPTAVSSVSFLVGAISFFPFAILEFNNNPLWPAKIGLFNIFSVLFLGLVSAFLAYSLLEWGLSRVKVHIDQTISYLTSIVSILISTLLLGEKLYSIFPLSVFLVVAGIYLVAPYHRIQRQQAHRSHGI